MKTTVDNLFAAFFLIDAPIERIGNWDVCWRAYKVKDGLPSVFVEVSSPDGQTYRTMLPRGCVLVLGEQFIDKTSR
jgi:hypothetical protein